MYSDEYNIFLTLFLTCPFFRVLARRSRCDFFATCVSHSGNTVFHDISVPVYIPRPQQVETRLAARLRQVGNVSERYISRKLHYLRSDRLDMRRASRVESPVTSHRP